MDKIKKLKQVNTEIYLCEICKEDKIGIAVVGEGDPNADIAFIGEAPGKQEAKEGRPFIGRSGQLLRKLIKEVGLKENEVYITSPVKYLPVKGTPSEKEIAHGRTHLKKQLEVINPKIIVLLGKVAAKGVVQKEIPISKMHGTKETVNRKTYFYTYHPAAGLRFPKLKQLLIEDFKLLKEIINEEK